MHQLKLFTGDDTEMCLRASRKVAVMPSIQAAAQSMCLLSCFW